MLQVVDINMELLIATSIYYTPTRTRRAVSSPVSAGGVSRFSDELLCICCSKYGFNFVSSFQNAERLMRNTRAQKNTYRKETIALQDGLKRAFLWHSNCFLAWDASEEGGESFVGRSERC